MKDTLETLLTALLLYAFAFVAVPVIAYEIVTKGSDRYLDDEDTSRLMAFSYWGGIEAVILLYFLIEWWFA